MGHILKVLGYYQLPKQLQCTLALILQVSNSTDGINTTLPEGISSFGAGCGEHRSKIGVHFDGGLVAVKP